jgi:ribonuclease P protein component
LATQYSFARQNRILNGADFRLVFKARNKLVSGPLAIYLRSNAEGVSRLGITVSKKVSKKAVERNRIKRLAREFFRTHPNMLKGFDIIVNAFPGCAQLNNQEITQQLHLVWARAQKRCG